MSRTCQELESVEGKIRHKPCGLPAMARWANKRWVCFGHLDALEQLDKKKRERDVQNPPRR